ncbi:hypothetical protein C8R45DRAFT_128399 [Mycena sanguinolenta]|nr:hypothetical protein C8R45DRAFT_128399 [Mycena sanguinolenta]
MHSIHGPLTRPDASNSQPGTFGCCTGRMLTFRLDEPPSISRLTSRPRVGAFYTASDSIVNEHLRERLPNEVHIDASLLLQLWKHDGKSYRHLTAPRHVHHDSCIRAQGRTLVDQCRPLASVCAGRGTLRSEEAWSYASLIFSNELDEGVQRSVASSSRGPRRLNVKLVRPPPVRKICRPPLFIDPDTNSTNPMDMISPRASTRLILLYDQCLEYRCNKAQTLLSLVFINHGGRCSWYIPFCLLDF